MKTTLLHILFFLSTPLFASVDSVSVQNHVLKIPVPAHWALVDKSDGLQGDSSWNAVLAYKNNQKQLYVNLAFKVVRRVVSSGGNGPDPRKYKIEFGYDNTAAGDAAYLNIIYPKMDCNNCRKSYSDYFIYYLNTDLDLLVFFTGKGKKRQLDSLTIFYDQFKEKFFSLNRTNLLAFEPSIVKTSAAVVDTFLYDNRYYHVQHSPDNRTDLPANSIHKGPDRWHMICGNTMIIIEEPSFYSFESPSATFRNFKPIVNSKLNIDTTRRLWSPGSDTIFGNNPAHKEFHSSVTDCSYITYKAMLANSEADSVFFMFTITFPHFNDDPLLEKYYERYLSDFIEAFLQENELKGSFFEIGKYLNGINAPVTAPPAPVKPGRKTGVE